MTGSSIEVVDWDNSKEARTSLRKLTKEVFKGYEPGYQIDGVQTVTELFSVFEAVKTSMPFTFRRQFVVNSLLTGLEPPKDGRPSTIPIHEDQVDGITGIAIHQNIRGPGKLLLANLAAGDEYIRARTSSVFEPDYSQLKNIREGSLKPGRLTVIAEGGHGSMVHAHHFFDRRGQSEDDQWIRYGYSPERQQDGQSYNEEVLNLAQVAFALLSESSIAA
jgi:hypothetical protein